MIAKNCLICNKGFTLSNYREKTAKFCSTFCKKKMIITKKGNVINCEYCGKGFYLSPCYISRNKRFCSNKCKFQSYVGSTISEETRKKLSLSHIGNVGYWKNKKRPLLFSEETRKRMGDSRRGEKSSRWISDRSQLKRCGDAALDRRSYAYDNWRMQVWMRDEFKCRIANQDCEGRLEAHHILSYTKFVELRYEINNGITLCHAHHPRKRAEEKRLVPIFKELLSNSNVNSFEQTLQS